MSKKYLVELYYDGPVLTASAKVMIHDAVSEGDAVRQAMLYLGLPKIGEVTRIET
jgi:hypothetical protein